MENKVHYISFLETLQYAASKHAGQFRKGTDIPYIVHPVAVAETLARYNLPEYVVYAGLLHDVLEDTNTTKDKLGSSFGTEVADLVAAVSETKKDDEGAERSWDIRKAEQLAHLCTADLAVVQLKAGDTLHNLRSIVSDLHVMGNALWMRFRAGQDRQLNNYTQLVTVLCDRLGNHPLAVELHVALDELVKTASST